MGGIGGKIGADEASPALAWLVAKAGESGDRRRVGGIRPGLPHSEPDGRLLVRTERPSPVVLDFIGGAGVQAVKSYQGYWLSGGAEAVAKDGQVVTRRTGSGRLVVYNFAPEAAEVTLPWSAEISPVGSNGADEVATKADAPLFLQPGERREIPVVLRARTDAFLPSDARLAAEVRCGGQRTVSRWATRFYAIPQGYVAKDRRNFDFPGETAEANRTFLMTRPLAPEEPPLKRDGRWLVTEGMRVEETSWGWRLHVDHFPGVALRPAVAELPLPSGWRMPEGTVLSYDYRLLPGEGAQELRADNPDAQRRRQTGTAGPIAESYIRTANGNLFSTVPRLSPKPEWKRYNQSSETLTMMFLGRAELPWRFLENQPAALVFFVRPTELPAVFEVRDPHQAAFGVAEK